MVVQSRITPDNGVKPLESLMQEGAELKTALALCKVRLYQGAFPLLSITTLAELEAAEADFSGYPAGGIEVTAAGDPYIGDNDSVFVTLPLVQFNHSVGSPNVENEIGGAFVVDANDVLRGVVAFDSLQPMANNSHAIPVVVTFRVGQVPESDEE